MIYILILLIKVIDILSLSLVANDYMNSYGCVIFLFMKINDKKGFTLVELMISIAIIGLLAAVSASGYKKYINSAYKTEGMLKLKNAYISEIAFVSTQPIAHHLRRGEVCQPAKRLSGISSFYSTSPACTGRSLQTVSAPKGIKAYICILKSRTVFLDASCTDHEQYSAQGNLIGYGTPANETFIGSGFEVFRISESPGYFTVYAGVDSTLAAEYSVSIDETLSIRAVADTNGNSTAQGYTVPVRLDSSSYSPLSRDTEWVLQRGMYILDGEIQSTPGVYEVNFGE